MQKNARQLAVEVIYRVNEEGGYSNLTLNQLIRKYDITDRDKALATQLVYGSLRMRNSLDWLINQVANRKVKKMDGWTRNILRLGLYQIQFLDGIPDAVACNETVELAKEYKHPGVAKFVNGVLRNILRRLDSLQMPSIEDDPVQHIRYKYSFPQWLVERWVKRYGVKATIEICQAFNQIPNTVIRRNQLKVSKPDLVDSLSKNDIEVEEINNIPQAFKIANYSSLSDLDTFQSGCFQIQGLASILTGHIVAPKPGERVLDLCSAPGGKTTHLAELMDNQGKIIANELHEHKLSLIEENCKRLGIEIVNVKIGDGRKVEFADSFDRILIDAPCSGLGMIAKKPEIKWQKKPQDIKQLKDIQLELLTAGSGFLKEGGELVYSTCTITEAENIEVVKEFVSNNSNFELVNLKSQVKEFGIDSEFINEGTIQLLPTWQENEGYFVAKLRRIS
ncbi:MULTISPECIES: 16S rRNA (cytosine(967)-C(5))-methyltransferase RsmB [unclassified Candidatus Frackibacter]|uniref:16S rRNA (cytosine(967)-C(5))-methyltransferase RsmB n=1 Tax=unclassified Candidatus Frackibacter TaxID=2648818 RepID=UPI0008837C5E|nr:MULTISPECIES: 16S rRNA (cytosine(967)-C(5))-methyltransferase RsmB [unclassified Candidatus Frackibacter]SDC57605.1 NusB antitermination factor [Candidatus Frackibacter sp. WG11]SEM71717.1 NusB antitermination factor [Candidatus Frackibacter sp. WG12]SFL82574.1 NusB antitermination factor [Candidatus Frackibacter sp. WG13]